MQGLMKEITGLSTFNLFKCEKGKRLTGQHKSWMLFGGAMNETKAFRLIIYILLCTAMAPWAARAQHMWIAGNGAIHRIDYNGQVVLTSGALPSAPYRIAQYGTDGSAWTVFRDRFALFSHDDKCARQRNIDWSI